MLNITFMLTIISTCCENFSVAMLAMKSAKDQTKYEHVLCGGKK